MSGIPFWGMDQGGFCVEKRYEQAQRLYDQTKQENEDLREWRELQTRWNQFGAFIPLFRSHGQWPLREIWNIAPEDHPAYKSFVYYDRLRYHLMPYLYSLAGWAHSLAGWAHFRDYTLMRALVMDFGGDREVENIGNQWMLGPALMACPVGYYKARNRSIYFPKACGWYDLYTGEQIMEKELVNSSTRQLIVDAPYERIPVFVREGAIIPFGPAMTSSTSTSMPDRTVSSSFTRTRVPTTITSADSMPPSTLPTTMPRAPFRSLSAEAHSPACSSSADLTSSSSPPTLRSR